MLFPTHSKMFSPSWMRRFFIECERFSNDSTGNVGEKKYKRRSLDHLCEPSACELWDSIFPDLNRSDIAHRAEAAAPMRVSGLKERAFLCVAPFIRHRTRVDAPGNRSHDLGVSRLTQVN